MSTNGSAAAGPSSQRGTGGGLPEATVGESVRLALTAIVPNVLRGLFTERRGVTGVLTRLDVDGRAVAVSSDLRRRRGGAGAKLFGGRLVVLWDPAAIAEVLDRSAQEFVSDAGAKGKGMSHFQPDALTVSRGEAWRDRRAFNESVLATDQRLHPDARRFAEVVAEEVTTIRTDGDELSRDGFERLFDFITLRVVFGDRAREDQELTGLLEQLMAEANRLIGVGDGTDDYYEFYGRLERQLLDPEEGSLLARFAEAPSTDRTRTVHQIPHWMFAMRDTLQINTFRALAAIVADPELEQRVRSEVEGADLDDPEAIDGLTTLDGCLEEAMRLWPTTPLLAREATCPVSVAGAQIDKGAQVMMLNQCNHRDPDLVEDADRVVPERWDGVDHDYRFNHLANGTQACPGSPLVHLIGKAVLARMLDGYEVTLRAPALPAGDGQPHMLNASTIRFGLARRHQPA